MVDENEREIDATALIAEILWVLYNVTDETISWKVRCTWLRKAGDRCKDLAEELTKENRDEST